MTRAREPKAVEAWAVFVHDGAAFMWTVHTLKRDAVAGAREWRMHGYDDAKAIRVRITPLRPRAPKARRKA